MKIRRQPGDMAKVQSTPAVEWDWAFVCKQKHTAVVVVTLSTSRCVCVCERESWREGFQQREHTHGQAHV